MRTQNEEARRHKQIEIMENSFNCYAENGFSSVGIKAIAKACDCSVATLYKVSSDRRQQPYGILDCTSLCERSRRNRNNGLR